MEYDTLLYTLPQWFIFSGIMILVYGWVEKKKPFRLIGSALLVILGVYAIWVLTGDALEGRNYLSDEEIMRKELDDETYDDIPFLARLFPAYLVFLVTMIFALVSLYLDWKDHKRILLFHLLAGFTALLGFFIIVGAIKTL